MKLIKILLVNFCFIFLFGISSEASHIIGGEMGYVDLGNNRYEIILKIFRDCSNPASAPYDDPTYVTVFDTTGVVIQTIAIKFPGSVQVPITTVNSCLVAPPNICVQQAIFIDTVTLPPIPGGYILAYQRCCRNSTIINIPINMGATYAATIPDSSIANNNSSPTFTYFPPTVVCVNTPLAFDHSATDPDGDSLAYTLFDPYDGANPNTPEPVPANPPPFPLLAYTQNYSYSNPFGAGSPLNIDPVTGLLTCTPHFIGQFVVAIGVKEYRHGVLLGTHYRDFQFNVVNCNNASKIAAAFTSNVSGSQVTFNSSASVGAATYAWDFGDGSIDTTANPVHFYNVAGNYNVCLKIYNDSGCYTTQCHNILVGVPTVCNAYFTYFRDTIVPHHWYVLNGSTGKQPVNYTWSWGDGTSSTGATTSHTYVTGGYYSLSLQILDDTGCTSSFRDSLAYFYRMEDNVPVKIDVVTSLPTSIKSVSVNNNSLSVYPNPCNTCFVSGIDNLSDVSVTDVLGRSVNATLTKTPSGAQIDLTGKQIGFFIVKNLRTGQVVKFIRQ